MWEIWFSGEALRAGAVLAAGSVSDLLVSRTISYLTRVYLPSQDWANQTQPRWGCIHGGRVGDDQGLSSRLHVQTLVANNNTHRPEGGPVLLN